MRNSIPARHQNLIRFLLLVAISIFVYLPRVTQIGYLNDDWYLMYSAHAYGPNVFSDIFGIDRPARAFVLTPAYTLFGDNPLYYNLSAYFFRLIAGLSFFWFLRMLWPRQGNAMFVAALLFLLYPGFLSQINGIDYQSQMVSLACAMLSLALSVKASIISKPVWKTLAWIVAILLGLFYLGLVEYFLGLEILRLASLYLAQSGSHVSDRQDFLTHTRNALPGLVVPILFLIWRVFFFESERGATDISSQLAQFKELPLATSVWWAVRLISNTFNVMFLAWGVPLYQFISYISRLRDLFIAFLIVAGFLLFLFWWVRPLDDESIPEREIRDYRIEMLLLGLLTAFAGLVPVILVNRQADFGDFSRYTLASSPGSALVLAAILFFLTSRAVRWGLFALLVTVAVFTHHANTIRVVRETQSLRLFWWQVSWRIPQLKMDTTLVANYPITAIQEDYFVWGPANLIYYPDGLSGDQTRAAISAAVLNKYSLLKILSNGAKEQDNRRSITSITDYQNILIFSSPTSGSCVQVINGSQPEISSFEEERVMVIAPYSNTDLIDLTSADHTPPQVVFGPEPAHEWCYYYEKADLARQRGDWEEVIRLGNEAIKKRFGPQDDIEWMPFLQAYVRAGAVDRLDKVHSFMKNAEPYVAQQVCKSLSKLPDISAEVRELIDSQYCFE